MFYSTAKFKCFQVTLIALLLSVALSVFASKETTHVNELFSTTSTTFQAATFKSSPNSFVTLDFSKKIAESWDRKGQVVNMKAHCINGDVITGVEYANVTIETVGNSFFSETRINFSDSDGGGNDINLAIGSINESSGTASFNSNGISDITDSGNVDVVSLGDKIFNMEFYETIDDSQGEIDARFTNGILKIWGVNLTPAPNCPFISTTTGNQGADLSVDYNLSAAKALIGDSISFDIVVSNAGPDEATDVVIANMLSPNLQFVQLTCDDGTTVSDPDPIASVNVSNIPATNVLNCVLNATIISAGSIESEVTVTASNDLIVANNSAAIVLAGAASVVPINNVYTLLLLVFGLLVFARKYSKA